MAEISFIVDALDVELEPWPLTREQVLAGEPEVSGRVLDTSADGRVERGVWQHTPGASSDVEADELFVVIAGKATLVIEGGSALALHPGVVGILHAGDRTVWTVQETLRKVYQVTS